MANTKNTMVYTQTLRTAQAVATAACTTYGDAANKVLLLTAGVDGALVKKLTALPRQTVSDTQLQLYLSKDSGTTMQLVGLAKLPSYTMSQSTEPVAADFKFTSASPFRLGALPAGERLYVSTGLAVTAGIVFHAEYEDF